MDPFIGEIRLLPYTNFSLRGWALCNGALLPISQNTALFSLLGVQYGGDGRSTFGLPNLQGRTMVGIGQGPGLSSYTQGQMVGTETVTLLPPQMPAHAHTLSGTVPVLNSAAASGSPQGSYYATAPSEQYGETADHANTGTVLSGTTGAAGSGQAHENRQPYLVLNYYIALQGIFPQRP